MSRSLILTVVMLALLPAVGCVGSRKSDITTEAGIATTTQRIRAGEGPCWKIVMPVVHRNREPKASTWPAAVESAFEIVPDAVSAGAASAEALAGIGVAADLGKWAVPDLSNTQNVVFEFDGLATKVTVKGIHQEETAEGRVITTVEEVEVEVNEALGVLGSQ